MVMSVLTHAQLKATPRQLQRNGGRVEYGEHPAVSLEQPPFQQLLPQLVRGEDMQEHGDVVDMSGLSQSQSDLAGHAVVALSSQQTF